MDETPQYGDASSRKRSYEDFVGEEYQVAASYGGSQLISPLAPLTSTSQLQQNGTVPADDPWSLWPLLVPEVPLYQPVSAPTPYPEPNQQLLASWGFSALQNPLIFDSQTAQDSPIDFSLLNVPYETQSGLIQIDGLNLGSVASPIIPSCIEQVIPIPANLALDDSTHTEHEETQEIHNPGTQFAIQPDIVCFGMVTGVAGTCHLPASFNALYKHLIQFADVKDFVSTENATLKGEVIPKCTYITSALIGEEELELEAYCSTEEPPKTAASGFIRRRAGFSRPCFIDIIIYGPRKLFNDVGEFFQDHDLYLQDPVGCKRNVPYCNPHRLPPRSNGTNFTYDLEEQSVKPVVVEDVDVRPELLDLLDSQEYLAETEQPPSIRTTLARHQKQALTFMRRREHGWAWDGSSPDIWEEIDAEQENYFANRISNTTQTEEPPQFYGGIVADPMGLGKTLSMIALIAYDMHLDYKDPSLLSGADLEESSGRTLVIVPPPLLISWEEQLKEHISPNSLPWCRHHAKSRLTDPSQLESTMIVLTTYHTVSHEWRNDRGNEPSILFKTRWKRIVLDEAHFIRNADAQISRAVCSLNSVSRWAVTGTPIQNKLGDLSAVLKFLKVYPYSEKKVFEADISHLWKSGNDEEAVKRLKRLSSCLILRRPKETIQLPERRDLQYPVEFAPAERQLYEEIRTQVMAHIDEALQSGEKSRMNSFVNVLQRIEAMRMVCNLGLHYHTRHELSKQTDPSAEPWDAIAQKIFNMRREMDEVRCVVCLSMLDNEESIVNNATQPLFSYCLKYACSSCTEKISQKGEMFPCGDHPPCPVATILTDSLFSDETPVLAMSNLGGNTSLGFPTKIMVLLEDLQTLPGDVKCVIFSTWRMTLDVVQRALNQASIQSLRFDGKVPQKDRQGVIDRFRNDPSIRVLLLTLSCGAVGLTLTAASRAYLMEPHWNPTLEDQALARIHRMGQTRDVTTVRFFVRNSFEERVIEAQQSKRDLAGILLNPYSGGVGDEAQSGTTTRPLEWLRALI